jgi:hypothetical protein
LPTFLQVAHVAKPANLPLDGVSLLPVLLKASAIQNVEEVYNFQGRKHVPGEKEIQLRYFPQFSSVYDALYNDIVSQSGDGKHEKKKNDDQMASFLFHEGYRHIHLNEIDKAMTRVFLWHKDTDPYSRDERMQSAGHYDHVKVLTSSPTGCFDRIFDMKLDPVEHFNLFQQNGPRCKINYNTKLDLPMIISVLNKQNVISHHCSPHHQNTSKYKKLMEILKQQSSLSFHGININTCEEFYNYYYSIKIYIILKKLFALVHTGNLGHQKYMKDDSEKATCKIPLASQIKPFDFTNVCSSTDPLCSIPEF